MFFGSSGWKGRDTGPFGSFFSNKLTGGPAKPAAIVGDQLDNVLKGTELNDVINGLGGNDSILGLGGDDIINGDAGNDTIDGGLGNDVIRGGAGRDSITGGEGNDDLFGGDGSDRIRGRAGDDTIEGGRDDGTITQIDSVYVLETVFRSGGMDFPRTEEIEVSRIADAGQFLKFSATDLDVSSLTFAGRFDDGDAVFIVNNANDNTVTWTVAGPGGAPSFTLTLFANQSAVLNVGAVATDAEFTVTPVSGAGAAPGPATAGEGDIELLDRYLIEGGDRITGGDGADTFIYKRGDGADEYADFEVGVDKMIIKGYKAKDVTIFAGEDLDDTVVLFRKNGDKDHDFRDKCGGSRYRDDDDWSWKKHGGKDDKYGCDSFSWKSSKHESWKFGYDKYGRDCDDGGKQDEKHPDKVYGFEQSDALFFSDVQVTIDDLIFG